MSYYGARGDFYTGSTGYYQGDPGFLGGLWGAVRGIAGRVVSNYTGGIIPSNVFGGGGNSGPSEYAVSNVGQQPTISAAGSAAQRGMHRRGSGSGRLSGMTGSSFPGTMGRAIGGMLVTRGQHRVAMAGGGHRRGRRMNVCNPRALRRAIRRAKGFEKLALRSIRLVSPHRMRGKVRGGFKKTASRRR